MKLSRKTKLIEYLGSNLSPVELFELDYNLGNTDKDCHEMAEKLLRDYDVEAVLDELESMGYCFDDIDEAVSDIR